MMSNYDYVVIGAGIVGLTLAYTLNKQEPKSKILIIEKESELGVHASGRNSGVLHSGIYYEPNTLKAKLCTKGHTLLKNYILDNNLPLNQCGKVVVCPDEKSVTTLNTIHSRAKQNGVNIKQIDELELKQLEPLAKTTGNKALWVPDTAVFDPKSILNQLLNSLTANKVEVLFNSLITNFDVKNCQVKVKNKTTHNYININYGHLFNTAGLFADEIAQKFDLNQYTILPFKGIYHYINNSAKFDLQKLIYPTPNIDLPFLGVHITKNINNQILIGPSAFPAFGRENYQLLKNLKVNDISNIFFHLLKQYYYNKNSFRNFVHYEIKNFLSHNFYYNNLCKLMPAISKQDISKKSKVGIRAQLVDLERNTLVMDLLVKNKYNTTHVLNAVSPAFTCSFALAEYLVDEHL